MTIDKELNITMSLDEFKDIHRAIDELAGIVDELHRKTKEVLTRENAVLSELLRQSRETESQTTKIELI